MHGGSKRNFDIGDAFYPFGSRRFNTNTDGWTAFGKFHKNAALHYAADMI